MDSLDRDVEKAEMDAGHPAHRSRSLEHVRTISSSTASSVAEAHTTASHVPAAQGACLERHPTALSRINTLRSVHDATVGRPVSRGTLSTRESRRPLPAFGAGKSYPPPLPEQEQYVVEFDGVDDPLHAQNWSIKRKLFLATILGFTTFVATFGSSIFSPAIAAVAEEFGVSSEVTTLGVSLYVLGFSFGPILWAPFSELYGRRMPLVISSFVFSIFHIAVATGKDLQTVLICRFFCGFCGACPISVVAAVFSDMFDNSTRGMAITVFSMTVFTGPLMAPFIGGFITMSYLGWRWTSYITAIMGFTCFGLNLLFLRETYPPVILVQKAAELRRRTKNWGIHAKQEEIEIDVHELLSKNFSRPLRLLFLEPIVLLISIYMSFIYGLLYLFLTAYPLVFQKVHGMNEGVGGLPYFGMMLGYVISGFAIAFQEPAYVRKLLANQNRPVPEWRLPPVMYGGAAFAAGLFWFGWSGYRADVHWMVPTASGVLIGFGILSIFLQALNYLVDAYLMFAASAIAGNTFMRSMAGAAFPMFGTYMFNGMGIEWASTLLGCVAVVLVPIPVFFYVYGRKIRARSKFAPEAGAGGESDVFDEKSGGEDEDA
ncbi:MAG: hypothetical protein M1819_001987 [Sarea resinae]|nr:MAG: hypothetical protein M1819_001987 [Sarea resinae]